MKRLIAIIAMLTLCIGVFAGCGENNAPATTAPVTSDLDAAIEYIYTMYKDTAVVTNTDYTVVSKVAIGTTTYDITWTADTDAVTIGAPENNTVTIDVNEDTLVPVDYKLTATIKDAAGNTKSVSFSHSIPVSLSYAAIVDLAYELEAGKAMEGTYELLGVIKSIDTPYSADYKNITVTIEISGKADKPIQCYRLKGEGADTLAVGDEILVSGVLKNYNGTIEFDAGCELKSVIKSVSQLDTLKAAYALAAGTAFESPVVLKGEIISIDTPYSDQYKNITVTIVCDGHTDYPIKCYRVKGEGAEALAVGGTIAVKGIIKNYVHSSGDSEIEFDQGCELIKLEEFSDLFAELNSNISVPEGGDKEPEATEPEGNTGANTGDVTLANGMKVVIYAPAYGKALSSEKTGYYNVGKDVTVSGSSLTGYGDNEIFTVIANADGTFSFEQGGKKLALAAEFTSMNLGEINDTWKVESLGNGLYNIFNVGREVYMEWYNQYSNWSSYGTSKAATDDQFQLSFFVVK